MTTIEERFQAAVNVIKGLPKNGPYQPSNDMMLKFYGYYKHVNEGPCNQKRPPFYDIVGRAKWDSWNAKRHLTKQQAMAKYVDSLREIIETMSFTENVQNFVGSLAALDNISLNDLEVVAPGMREIAESHPDSPYNSRANSPKHGTSGNSNESSDTRDELPTTNEINTLLNGHDDAVSENNDVKPFTGELSSETTKTANMLVQRSSASLVEQSDDEYGDPYDLQHDLHETLGQQTGTLQQIQFAVRSINADLVALNQRTISMENCLRELRHHMQLSAQAIGSMQRVSTYPDWWPFRDISPAWFAVLLLWPFIVRRFRFLLPLPSRRQ